VYNCLNCGVKFLRPVINWMQRDDLNLGILYSIHPSALYMAIPVCPRCGSDAIEKVKDGEDDG